MELEQSYWGGNGKHQTLYNELLAKLVPESGKCDTVGGELLRAISRIAHDWYNNGGWNNTSGASNYLQGIYAVLSEQGRKDLAYIAPWGSTMAYLDEFVNEAKYSAALERLADEVILLADKLQTQPNTQDMFDLQDDEQYPEDEDDGWDNEDQDEW